MALLDFKTTSLFVTASLSIFLLVAYRRTGRIRKGSRLPPGPPGRFIGGNAKDMPSRYLWEAFDRWAKEYGPIVHINVFGQSMVILNTMEVAQDLCGQRSSIYSDRFQSPMLDLMGWGFNFAAMRYGESWRRHRRMFNEGFHPKASMEYHSIHVKQTKTLLLNFYHSPGMFRNHLRHLSGSTILEVVYGIQPRLIDDPYIVVAEKALEGVAEAGNPGTFLIDTFPILKYVPEWVPGAGFKKKARLWREAAIEMIVAPLATVKKATELGTAATESVVFSLLERMTSQGAAAADEEEIIRNVAGAAYVAGTDTTFLALNTFMLAMLCYPEVQKKAQAELDSVVGIDRLPGLEDRENLPYVSAVYQEVHRWHPALPLGVAHRVMQDDVYGEYFIPGGSIVFANAWSILRDEKAYGPMVNEFVPERFLQPDVIDPIAQFGFGRRICPGRYLASNTMWLAIASILHAFDISPARGEDGKEIPVNMEFEGGLLSGPEPFACSIVPRSARATSLILE